MNEEIEILRCTDVVPVLSRVEELLGEYLADNTEEGFEEIPEIDDARMILVGLIEELTS
jgi:uncharacterized protein YehS (DUF1456 family)